MNLVVTRLWVILVVQHGPFGWSILGVMACRWSDSHRLLLQEYKIFVGIHVLPNVFSLGRFLDSFNPIRSLVHRGEDDLNNARGGHDE